MVRDQWSAMKLKFFVSESLDLTVLLCISQSVSGGSQTYVQLTLLLA
jgi:hypothetical protein